MKTRQSHKATIRLIPMQALLRYKARIQSKLADAIRALEAADDKFGQSIDEGADFQLTSGGGDV